MMMSQNALYTDLSGYYDLMCCDINYLEQSRGIIRLHNMLGNGQMKHLDLACGSAPHIQHFLQSGYDCIGLDLNQPMLDLAKARCPDARFMLQNMCHFNLSHPVDLITCFLYSIHYSPSINELKNCIKSAYNALNTGGMLCFNSVDKTQICNRTSVRHTTLHENSHFEFESGWHYQGEGEQQKLKLRIAKTTGQNIELWQDEHPMVAITFSELEEMLTPYFDVHILAHDYEKIQPWDNVSGNAIFVCIKK